MTDQFVTRILLLISNSGAVEGVNPPLKNNKNLRWTQVWRRFFYNENLIEKYKNVVK